MKVRITTYEDDGKEILSRDYAEWAGPEVFDAILEDSREYLDELEAVIQDF